MESQPTGDGAIFVLRDAATGELVRREEVPEKRTKVEVRQLARRVLTNVILILQDADTGKTLRVVEAHNAVTLAGGEYYAERGAAETPTYTFNAGKMALASSYRQAESVSVARTVNDLVFTTLSGVQVFDGGYPKTTDSDTDNTGSGVRVITYRRTYTTSQGNFTIKALGIGRNGFTTNPASSASLRVLLNYVTLSVAQQITKTSSQTLKVFVNHTMSPIL